MRPSDLSPAQAEALRQQIARHLRWASRLWERMQAVGFSPDDEMVQAALRTRKALQDLHVAAHYAGVQHGVGKLAEGAKEWVAKRA